MKTHKLLILAKSIDGGTGTFLLNFLKIDKLFKKGQLSMKAAVLEKPSYRTLSKTTEEKIVFLRNIGFYPQKYRFSVKETLGFFEELVWIRHQIRNFNPNIILGIDLYSNLLVQINKLLFFRNTKTILTTHIDLGETLSQKSNIVLNFTLKKFVSFFYNKADELVCVSKSLAKKMTDTFELDKGVAAIYNGLNLKTNPKIKSEKVKKNAIITIARLVEQKDHTTLISAFNLVQKEIPGARLLIASEGPLRNKLKKQVRKLNLSKKIKFVGWVKSIYPYLQKSSIFILASKREGFGYALIEAMSQGLPVISTDTPFGPSEILDRGKYGILVPVGDAGKLKNAITTLLTNKDKYKHYSKRAAERSKFFSLDKMLKSYKKLIIRLLA